ncbi:MULTISPECIES: hypothetical protein [Streptomyces]|uniref:Secreted protein n=2 Tax=Streptomyces TaxID=1883 RepID=A0A2U9P1N2_STRAS|nr:MULTISPECIES: hypothetical protein [Streptomyces]AWT43075.1 hypothetical protein DMT42_12590 [Streptomyces actuosus]MBM4824781.1 hypothetical protein [Streptomyces actuosus]GHF70418.1 hypothetical protein GCM10018783_45030 [Streptomyces griseosporeus]
MKKKLARVLAVGAAAVGVLAFSAGPASAGGVSEQISGAYGSADFYYSSKTTANRIYLKLLDRAPDGHHVRLRVQSVTPDRVVTSYAWRKVTTGAGTTGEWVTDLQDTRGIRALRIQVCVFEGDSALGCDESKWDDNTYY